MIEADFWAHHYAENPAVEEFETEGFDPKAYLARIEAEGEAAAGSGADGGGGEIKGEPPPPADPGDWEPLP